MVEQGLDIVGCGYQGHVIDSFIEDLQRRGVERVVDVRLTPLSRKKGFSKRLLSAALSDNGIEYSHYRALGNPKWNRNGFGGSESELEIARANFAGIIQDDQSESALHEVAEFAKRGRVALLCFEADELRCHRYVIRQILVAQARTMIPI
jgi:uncharacterized protein (DUF488 family)